MDGISPTQLLLSLVLSGLGGYVGVRVAVVQLQTNMTTAMGEIKNLRNRTHKHSTLITIIAARVGLNVDPSNLTSPVED